jgi:hypothetical protein
LFQARGSAGVPAMPHFCEPIGKDNAVTTIRRMSATQCTAFVVALVVALAGLTGAAGGSSKQSPVDRRAFRISGDAPQTFVPGSKQSLDLTIINPDNAPLVLTSVSVTVQERTSIRNAAGPRAGCSGTANLVVVQGFRGVVTVPANTSESLSAAGATADQLPEVEMRDLRMNQDGCKNVTFHFTYAGTAARIERHRSRHHMVSSSTWCHRGTGWGSRNGHNAR